MLMFCGAAICAKGSAHLCHEKLKGQSHIELSSETLPIYNHLVRLGACHPLLGKVRIHDLSQPSPEAIYNTLTLTAAKAITLLQ
jgi:hypothetical protein